jgi:hypothetical protein
VKLQAPAGGAVGLSDDMNEFEAIRIDEVAKRRQAELTASSEDDAQ